MDTREFEEFKENMQRDLNAEEYPFVVTVEKNKVVARWKMEQDEPFSVTYTLRGDKTFCGGETTLQRDTYHPMEGADRTTYYSLSTPETLRWKKKVNPKEWAKIGHDEEKLLSIVEHYLMDHGFSYRPGVWNHKRLSWEAGRQFRMCGVLFLAVGLFLLISFLHSSMIRDLLAAGPEFGPMILLATAILLPLLAIILGALMALVGFRIMDFYDLRWDIAIKVVLGTVIGSWLLLLVCVAVFGGK
ncbi:hypothetical protein SAMN02910301_1457 [Lachnospiraceae bacterium XBD2001]|nr:hypothetical protein SAMN02910301_1457 [Lachnospiraceae bacterium XBD2001]